MNEIALRTFLTQDFSSLGEWTFHPSAPKGAVSGSLSLGGETVLQATYDARVLDGASLVGATLVFRGLTPQRVKRARAACADQPEIVMFGREGTLYVEDVGRAASVLLVRAILAA